MTTGRIRLAAAASALALALAAPLAANAETQSVMTGTVVDFHGKYGLVVRDARGQLADVTLRHGTIIKPTGLRLERGMKVIIVGQASPETFAAGRIDAPLEVWPSPARAALWRALDGHGTSNDSNGISPAPNRDPLDTRWSEYPGQLSGPAPADPRNPH